MRRKLSATVGVTARLPCLNGVIVQTSAQQDVVEQAQSTHAGTVWLMAFGLKADALKAGAEMGEQVLNIVRIKAQLKLTMRQMHVPSWS